MTQSGPIQTFSPIAGLILLPALTPMVTPVVDDRAATDALWPEDQVPAVRKIHARTNDCVRRNVTLGSDDRDSPADTNQHTQSDSLDRPAAAATPVAVVTVDSLNRENKQTA